MAIDFQSKFDQLFGEETVTSAPTLRDVAPGLATGTTGARFESRELNPRRTAVSARNFRNPRVRSAEGAFERMGPSQTAQSFAQGAIAREARAEATGLGGQPGYQFGDSAAGGANLAVGTGGDVPNAVIGQIGRGALTSGLSTAALGTALGASPSQLLTPSIGSAMKSMVGPGALNSIAGGVISSEIGDSVYGNQATEDFGPGAADNWGYDEQSLQESARMANMNQLGAVGIVGRQLGSMITNRIDSPVERASGAIDQTKADTTYAAAPDNPNDIAGRSITDRISSAIGSQFSAPGAEAVAAAEAGGIAGHGADTVSQSQRDNAVFGGSKTSSSGSSDGKGGGGGGYSGHGGGGGYSSAG